MATAEQRNHAKAFLKKAEDNLAAGRNTPAAGDAIHAGISAKDAIVTALTRTTSKGNTPHFRPQWTASAVAPQVGSRGFRSPGQLLRSVKRAPTPGARDRSGEPRVLVLGITRSAR